MIPAAIGAQDFAAFDVRAAQGVAVARAVDSGQRIVVPPMSRNAREGHYAGHFRASAAADQPRRHRRQPYGAGQYITLREYGRRQRRDGLYRRERKRRSAR